MHLDPDAEPDGHRFGRSLPRLAPNSGQDRKPAFAAQIKGGVFRTRSIPHPGMWDTSAGGRGGLILQLPIGIGGRPDRPIRHHGGRYIPLVHFDPVAVKFRRLDRNRRPQRRALLFRRIASVAALVHVLLHDQRIDRAQHSQSLEYRGKLADRLIGAGDDLFGNWSPLDRIRLQQTWPRVALDRQRQFPRQIERVLNRGIRPQSMRRRMTVRRVADDEHPGRLHVGGVHIVDGPGVGADQFDLERRITDQLPGQRGRHRRVHLWRGFVDVIAADDQPFVPGAHHADLAHADAASTGPGLHHPILCQGAMRDVFGQIRLELNIDRPAHAHLALKRQACDLGHL